ncbi:hypothetical protein [Prevotella sp.]|uniref:hypothetical protein n=1 Tax=Prevotella sp. TaxID=59823 RepID=UPI003DA2AB35
MKEYETLNELFRPIYVDDISDDKLKEIAEGIICNSYINNGSDKNYIPIEIEFYYHSPRLPFKQDENYEKDHITYPRHIKESGKLLYHYSGIDICFESKECVKVGKERPEFGGILIRSLLKINDKNEVEEIIYGPLCCKDVLLNEAKKLPSLEYHADKCRKYDLVASKKRVGISNENTDLNLRYYAKEYEANKGNSVIKRWAYKNGDIHEVKGQSYNIKDKK